MRSSKHLANRIGFIVLGLTNNFAYVIMLSAAYDLLNQTATTTTTTTTPPNTSVQQQQQANQDTTYDNFTTIDLSLNAAATTTVANATTTAAAAQNQKYCNEHSTSTILLADTLPSLATKLFYPFFLVGLPTHHKAIATAVLSAAAFIITGVTADQVLIFTGVVCASFSSGLGESTYISNTHLYGDTSLSGWSIGTGGAGLFGAIAYAVLRMLFPIKIIMFMMLVVPLAMLYAFFCIIKPVGDSEQAGSTAVSGTADSQATSRVSRSRTTTPAPAPDTRQPVEFVGAPGVSFVSSGVVALDEQEQPIRDDATRVRGYGAQFASTDRLPLSSSGLDDQPLAFNFRAKLRCLPSLAKYFMPLLLVYFAEYFINQGLFELVYYPEMTFLDHAAQYRWFQVSYQLGVMISRSSLDFLQIKNIWTMSLLQAANALLFLAHASKLIHIPSFYLVIALIIYEGLLGGFTYVNTFYRIKKEVSKEKQEFCMSTVTIADSLGIVFAGIVALPVHDALCKLYI